MQRKAEWVRRIAAAAVAVCVCGAVLAQDVSDSAAKPAMMAKDADPDWDVVTVKPSDPAARYDQIDQHGRHVTFQFETVQMLLVIGYSVQKGQIVDAPDWVKTERWDIDGLVDRDGQMDLAQLQTMIRKALAERFGLRLHKDKREMSVYALTVTKGGPKMTANTSNPNGLLDQQLRDGNGQHTEELKNFAISDLALILEFRVDRPIVDRTGLKGRYDGTLKWTYDEDRAPTDGSAAPSLFTAIQEQLGLKLEPVKTQADVLVVDKVNMPGAN